MAILGLLVNLELPCNSSCHLFEWRMINAVDIDLLMTEDLFRLKNRIELYLFDLILLGCVVDPIIYAARMRQVRSGYARIWNGLVRRVARRGVYGPSTSSARCGGIRGRSSEAQSSSTVTGHRSINAVSSRVTLGRNDLFVISEEAGTSV